MLNSQIMLGSLFVFMPLFIALLVAVIILKGYSLWYSAQAHQKWWFIAMLVINTFGILEIIYLLAFRPKTDSCECEESEISSSDDEIK